MSEKPLGYSPLGAVWVGDECLFGLFSRHATSIELCLFDDPSEAKETRRQTLTSRGDGFWEARLLDIPRGQAYGYRVDGPWEPDRGLWFNPRKLLIDPYARALTRSGGWSPDLLAYAPESPGAPGAADSAALAPRSLALRDDFDWGDDRPPGTPWERSLIYECHVRGLTQRHTDVPPEHRGRFLGLASPPVVEHLLALGVTAVELMPAQHFVSERHLAEQGRENYWGYSPLGLFAPHAAYASDDRGAQVSEFKQMVKSLHAAGIEVLLDVVFNHTAEGGRHGPTLGLRGIDNASYYRLRGEGALGYEDFTGCGNTLDFRRRIVRRLTIDCLRYWVEEMRVDGFRFDLAPVLGRGDEGFDAAAPLFRALREEPALNRVKLIAEPWDVGPGGYQLGRFPAGWAEWNDRYRDTVRSFWRGDEGRSAELATRISGSQDLFPDRGPSASVNYFASHDGFVLQDLVSYERKHNEANGESNRDGGNHNLSRNWGREGPADDEDIHELRERVKRSFLATLAVSRGVPMLHQGDEMGRSRLGNNNPYCLDDETTWVRWELGEEERRQLGFSREMFNLRRKLAAFRRGRHFEPQDVRWLDADGAPRDPSSWQRCGGAFAALLAPAAKDPAILLLFNGSETARLFRLPPVSATATAWRCRLDTGDRLAGATAESMVRLSAHSLALFVADEGSAAAEIRSSR